MTHLSIGVIIYPEGLSVRHPKGARSIGIGHPRSGDRCTKTLPYPLDPLWVAEQSLQRPRQGVALTSQAISATPWRGRISFLHPLPRSSALRASTCGLKNDDPSGAAPLRDRQAVAAGEGSTTGNSLMGYEVLRKGAKKTSRGRRVRTRLAA